MEGREPAEAEGRLAMLWTWGSVPHPIIPPGGIEGEGAGFEIPLDAVDGELPLGGGGGDVGGEGGDQTQGADGQEGGGDGQVALMEEENPLLFGVFFEKELHHDPVLSVASLCGKLQFMREGGEKGRAVEDRRAPAERRRPLAEARTRGRCLMEFCMDLQTER